MKIDNLHKRRAFLLQVTPCVVSQYSLLVCVFIQSFLLIFSAYLSVFFSELSVAAMDTAQQPLSIESFSYSWLVNLRPSFESLESSFRTSLDVPADESNSFIEMDPRMPPSKRFFRSSQEFKFDFPLSQSALSSLVHADELFSNGYVLPLFLDASKMEACETLDSTSNPSTSSHAPKILVPGAATRCSSLRRCRILSRQIFHKYLYFLRPLYMRMRGGRRASSRDEGVDHSRVRVMKKWVPDTSPRISVAYSADDHWRKSCDSESSIYEAVLHCKRSIGN